LYVFIFARLGILFVSWLHMFYARDR